MENLGVFGKNFQENLCSLLVYDRPFCDQLMEVLDEGFFELKYLQVFTKKLFEYKKKYKVHPANGTLNSIYNTELDFEGEIIRKQVLDFFVRVQSATEIPDKDYVKSTSLDFCKKQVLKQAMVKSAPLLNQCSFEEIEKLITTALRLGTNADFGHDYIKDFDERFKFEARNPISTGWCEVDQITKGGLGQGELAVVLAPTGVGKSFALVHFGAQALKQGKNVVHYTLELSDKAVAQRYDSCLTGFDLNEHLERKDDIFDKIKDVDGQLIVKEYPTKSATTTTLRNHLEKIRQNHMEIDMIIVDYGDLLRGVTVVAEKRHELESIYEELRAIAQEFKCSLVTASQTNREGSSEEVITMKSISEAYNKCFVADFIISLSRTTVDKNSNTGRVFIAKNRNGPDSLIYSIFMDTGTASIKILEQEEVEDVKREQIKRKRDEEMKTGRRVWTEMQRQLKQAKT